MAELYPQRVAADIYSCYEMWKSRGAEFITEPKDKYGETRCLRIERSQPLEPLQATLHEQLVHRSEHLLWLAIHGRCELDRNPR